MRIVNLECPLTDTKTPIAKSGSVLKGESRHIRGLTTVPFDVVTLGNNHVFDYGTDAFEATRDLLVQNEIQFTGARLSVKEAQEPLAININGIEVGIISFSEGEDLTTAVSDQPGVFGWDINRVIELVQSMRARVQVIIVICHAGVEYIPFPPPYLANALREVAAAGADLIIGHHPHVPQGVHVQSGVPICYSLGNFVFFQPTELLYRKVGYFVKAGIAADGVAAIQLIPYNIGPDRLSLLTGENRRRFFSRLAALSNPLAGLNSINAAWHGFLKYYGRHGFEDEITRIMAALKSEGPKGAAMFRNRLTTPQHYHHLIDLMSRIMDGSLDQAPGWAVDTVADFFTRKLADGWPR